ncbi:hypothetical protein SO694_00233016 [Aureococcus anophagefferens]|uniref:Uncharacterized protein n=1 Tax=Aureococcus anophagefferens TaxID=44056 RepID=A0ABR1FSX0_AURAN
MEETSSWWPGSPRSGAPAPAREAPGAQTYDEIMARAAASRGEASSPRPVITLHRVGSGRRGGSKDPREYDRLESRLKALQKKISLVRSHLREADESAAAERAAELAEAEALAANTRANRSAARARAPPGDDGDGGAPDFADDDDDGGAPPDGRPAGGDAARDALCGDAGDVEELEVEDDDYRRLRRGA